jgi:hypothetical protein
LQAEGIASGNIFDLGFSWVIPNITIALRIFVSLPASVTSGERTFSVLKQVKHYCRSSMEQDPLNGFATLVIKCEFARRVGFSSVAKQSRYTPWWRLGGEEI